MMRNPFDPGYFRSEELRSFGTNAIILPGVEIGEGSALCPGAVATRSLAPWGMYSGSPARRVAPRRRDVLAIEQALLIRAGAA